jgi:hypothetical protein
MAKKNSRATTEATDRGIEDLTGVLGAGPGEGGEGENPDGKVLEKEETIARLRACAARMIKIHTFTKGQLVQWKKGLKNKRTPAYGEPVVTIEMLAQPVFDEETKSSGSHYFREPLTLVAGELDGDGDLLCFHYDARRFEPYKE